MLDFAAGNVPITHVTEADEQKCARDYPVYDMWASAIKKEFSSGTVIDCHFVESYVYWQIGLPVGVQCVALPNQEEHCLRLMKTVETLVRRSPANN
jgi:Asp-tRNA(Asn)/Glu-tRNA(Gln) amidotransferase A subunit family amidase